MFKQDELDQLLNNTFGHFVYDGIHYLYVHEGDFEKTNKGKTRVVFPQYNGAKITHTFASKKMGALAENGGVEYLAVREEQFTTNGRRKEGAEDEYDPPAENETPWSRGSGYVTGCQYILNAEGKASRENEVSVRQAKMFIHMNETKMKAMQTYNNSVDDKESKLDSLKDFDDLLKKAFDGFKSELTFTPEAITDEIKPVENGGK